KIIKTFNIEKRKNFVEFLGLLGYLQNITKSFQLFSCKKFNDKSIPINFSIIDNLKKKIKISKWYFLNENKKVQKFFLTQNTIFNLLNWSFPIFDLAKKKTHLFNLGHFFCDGLSIAE